MMKLEYLNNGIVDFASPTNIAGLVDEFRRLLENYCTKGCDLARETIVPEKSGEIRSIFGVHRQLGEVRAIINDAKLLGIACELIGREMYIYQSQVNLKVPGKGSGFAPHRDMHYFQSRDGIADEKQMVGVAITLVDTDSAMGPLAMIEQSHNTYKKLSSDFAFGGVDSLEHGEESYSRDPGLVGEEEIAAHSHLPIREISGTAGAITFFDPRVIHWSSDNLTGFWRPMLLVFFNSTANRPSIVRSPWYLSDDLAE